MGCSQRTRSMAMEYCHGLMAGYTKDLGREGSDRVLDKLVAVIEVHRNRDSVNHLHSLSVGNLEAIRDGCRVETLLHELLACTEQSTGHHDDGSGAITSLDVLSLRNFDELSHRKLR